MCRAKERQPKQAEYSGKENPNKINKRRRNRTRKKHTILFTQFGPKMTYVWRREQHSVPLIKKVT
jgi:hypothetical protein